MMSRIVPFAVAALFVSVAAHAEVKQAAPDSFFVAYSQPLAATPAKAYADIAQIQHWWDSGHTWSGSAANLSLKAEAGACFCERWPGGSVEHGRVVMALPDKLLRLDAALGPLQEFALKGILSFWIRQGDDGKTRLDVEYRVNGASTSGLDQFAPKVDEVLGEQVARLKRYIETGKPDAPPSTVAVPASPELERAALLEQWKHEAEQAAKKSSSSPAAKPAKPDPESGH